MPWRALRHIWSASQRSRFLPRAGAVDYNPREPWKLGSWCGLKSIQKDSKGLNFRLLERNLSHNRQRCLRFEGAGGAAFAPRLCRMAVSLSMRMEPN